MVSYFSPPELPSSPAYSHAARIDGGRVIYVSGQQALDAHGQLVGRDDFAQQAAQVFANVNHALAAAGADVSNVVAIYTHYVNRVDLPAYRVARAAFFAGRTAPAPASTTVQVSGLVAEGALLEVGVTALVPPPTVAASPEPITVVATLRARDGRVDELKHALAVNALRAPTEPGCLSYVVHRSLDDSQVFVLHETWTTREALAAHFNMPYMKALAAQRDQLLERREVIVLRRSQ